LSSFHDSNFVFVEQTYKQNLHLRNLTTKKASLQYENPLQ